MFEQLDKEALIELLRLAYKNVIIGIKVEDGKPIRESEMIYDSKLAAMGFKYCFRSVKEIEHFADHLKESSKFMRENFGKETNEVDRTTV